MRRGHGETDAARVKIASGGGSLAQGNPSWKSHAFTAAARFSVALLQLPALATDASSACSEASSSSVSSESSSAVSSESSSVSSSSSSMSSEPSSEPAKDNWGSLISALQAGRSTTDLTTITDATVVNFVDVLSKAHRPLQAIPVDQKRLLATVRYLASRVRLEL
jgi:hypothetical protein